MKVFIPSICLNEQNYILDVMLGEFLGLSFDVVEHQDSNIKITQSGSNNFLTLNTDFFQQAHKSWLKESSMPQLPLVNWNLQADGIDVVSVEESLPVLFGQPSLIQNPQHWHLSLDVFGSAFFMLSRYEELVVSVFESDDIGLFYELNNKTFVRQQRKIPYDLELIKTLYQSARKHNACKMYFAQDADGEIIAGNFLVYDESTVYYLMGGIDPDKKNLGGMDVVQFESIKFALESGRRFDFEGSMIESIEKYFRSFGAVQKPYFNLSKTNSKLLKIKALIKEII